MSDPRRNRFKTYAGVLVSVLLAALAGWVLWRTFQRIRFADVLAQMQAVPASTLALAGLCAAGAFTVLALYEVAVVRYVKQAVGRAKPILTAYIAFPLGHAVGQAMLSGGALRYRMYTPAGFSATEVGATVLLANMPYALGFGLLLDISLVFAAEMLEPMFRISSGWLRVLGLVGLCKDAGYVLLILLRKRPVKLGGWSVNLPTPAMTALQLCVGLADIFLVSAVLYLLLPASMGIPYLAFLGAYLASMLAGVLSHVPAGLGVLESMLLLLLPDVPPEQLLAAVLMYRVIYEIIPVLFALGALGHLRRLFARRCAVAPCIGRSEGGPKCAAPRARPSTAASERGLRPLSNAASTRGAMHQSPQAPALHFFIHQARQAERLFHQRVTPAVCILMHGRGQPVTESWPRTPAATGSRLPFAPSRLLARPSG